MENHSIDSQFDSQYHLLLFTLADISGRSTLLPSAYLHVALEEVTGDDEMLDIILQHTTRVFGNLYYCLSRLGQKAMICAQNEYQ